MSITLRKKPTTKTPQTEEALRQLRAEINADIEQKKREGAKIDAQLKTLAKVVQLRRAERIGWLAYEAGLGAVDDDLLRLEFAMLAKRLCGIETVLQLVDEDGRPLGRSQEDGP